MRRPHDRSVCIWPRRSHTKRDLYDRLDQITTQWERRKVVLQPNGVQRLDVVMPSTRLSEELMLAINKRKARNRLNGAPLFSYAKRHLSYRARRKLGTNKERSVRAREKCSSHQLVLTWNVRSVIAEERRAILKEHVGTLRPIICCFQETHLTEKHHDLYMRKYSVYERKCVRGGEPEEVGVAIGVRSEIVSKEFELYPADVPEEQKYKGLAVAEIRLNDQQSVLVGSLYATKRLARRKPMIEALSRLVKTKKPCIVLGDFNRRLEGPGSMGYLLGRADMAPWKLVQVSGSPKTFHRNVPDQNWTALDHAICANGADTLVASARVNRKVGMSDHFPLDVQLEPEVMVAPKPRAPDRAMHWSINLNDGETQGRMLKLATSNRFEALSQDIGDMGAEEAAGAWTDAVNEAGQEAGLRVPSRSYKHQEFRIARKAKNAIEKKQKAFDAMVRDPTECRIERYREATAEVDQFAAEDIRRQESKRTKGLLEATQKNDLRALWRKLKRLQNGGEKDGKTQPMRNRKGELVNTPEEIGEVWRSHFETLFKDSSGNSSNMDAEQWTSLKGRPGQPTLEDINGDITWSEVWESIQLLKNGKTPGNDDIISEVLRAASLKADPLTKLTKEQRERRAQETPYALFTDGGARGNPGPGGCGAMLRRLTQSDEPTDESEGHRVGATCRFLGRCTNNEAEFAGLVLGLQLAKNQGVRRLHVVMDSNLVVRAMTGHQRISKDKRLHGFWLKAMHLSSTFPWITYSHVKRHLNTEADNLANQAMNAGIARGLRPRLEELSYSQEEVQELEVPDTTGKARPLARDDPPNEFGWSLLRLLNQVWTQVTIPEGWHKAWIATIHKKGPKDVCGNYRGISLMNTTYKLLLMVLNARLYKSLEKAEFFTKAQAGFRSKEEAVLQSITLLDVLQRRYLATQKDGAQQTTYALFMDLYKAYDMVPRAALFIKLEKAGVRGRMLDFIKEMYAGATLTVGKASTEYFTPGRGVLQGCPLSPLLFNIFINDIFDEWEGGVEAPLNKNLTTKVPGLLFADDLVGLCNNADELADLTEHLKRWCSENEMQMSVDSSGSKTAYMVFHPNSDVRRRLKADLRQKRVRAGKESTIIPVVDAYKYLGSSINEGLDLSKIFKARHACAEKAARQFERTIGQWWIPTRIRRMLARAVVYPSWFGCELWGMQNSRVGRANKLIQKLCAWTRWTEPGVSHLNYSVCNQREVMLPPMHVVASRARSRAFLKGPTLRTYMKDLCDNPGRIGTWTGSTKAWIKSRAKPLAKAMERGDMSYNDLAKLSRKVVGAVTWGSYEQRYYSADWKLRRYRRQGFGTSNQWNRRVWEDSKGSIALRNLRTGEFKFACSVVDPQLARDPDADTWDCRACGSRRVETTYRNGVIHLFKCKEAGRQLAQNHLDTAIKGILSGSDDDQGQERWLQAYTKAKTEGDDDKWVGLLLGSTHGIDRRAGRCWYTPQGDKHSCVATKVIDYLESVTARR